MTIFFKNGFFDSTFCEPPEDAVAITDEFHQQLLEGQANGGVIYTDDKGEPYVAASKGPSEEEQLARCSAYAGKMLAATDWSMLPDCNLANKEEFAKFRKEMRALRSSPEVSAVWSAMPKPVWVEE